MSFEVKLTRQAEGQYLRLQAFLDARFREIGESPAREGRPAASPPHPPGGMVAESDFVVGSEWHHFAVFFFYGQDESSLEVIAIGHVEYSPGS